MTPAAKRKRKRAVAETLKPGKRPVAKILKLKQVKAPNPKTAVNEAREDLKEGAKEEATAITVVLGANAATTVGVETVEERTAAARTGTKIKPQGTSPGMSGHHGSPKILPKVIRDPKRADRVPVKTVAITAARAIKTKIATAAAMTAEAEEAKAHNPVVMAVEIPLPHPAILNHDRIRENSFPWAGFVGNVFASLRKPRPYFYY
jgi:hypothetical protein